MLVKIKEAQFVLFILLAIILIVFLTSTYKSKVNIKGRLNSLMAQNESVPCTPRVRQNDNIYFIESSRPADGRLKLRGRQACAVESAALMNPERPVTLIALHVSNISTPLVNALLSYPNVKIWTLTVNDLVKDTIAEDFLKSGKIFDSKYPTVHLSDFLRLLVLWKLGGTYYDLDVIVLKNLAELGTNFVSAETGYWVASVIISADVDEYGHFIMDKFVREFIQTFNGSEWSYNGPQLLTRVLQNICSTKSTKLMTTENCYDFKVHPTEWFYPIGYDAQDPLFGENKGLETMEKVKNSYSVHAWNALTASFKLKEGSKAGYAMLAHQYCPRVFGTIKIDEF